MVTADGFGALRSLISGLGKHVQRRTRFVRRSHVGAVGRAGSRWSLLSAADQSAEAGAGHEELSVDAIEARAAQLRRRLRHRHAGVGGA